MFAQDAHAVWRVDFWILIKNGFLVGLTISIGILQDENTIAFRTRLNVRVAKVSIVDCLADPHASQVIDIDTGDVLSGWPFGVANWPKGFPTVVDVDNDNAKDICFVTDGGELYALSSDGQVISGYPKSMVSASISGVGAGDIDGDGLFELVAATWDGWVYAWDTDSIFNIAARGEGI